MNSILKELGINNVNYGACSGTKEWSSSQDGGLLESINPSTGEVIASIYQATENDYEQIWSIGFHIILHSGYHIRP